MILVDANLLIYAYDPSSPFHRRAAHWLEDVLSGPETVCLSWFVIVAFFRVLTNKARPHSVPPAVAFGVAREWLQHPNVRILSPGRRHMAILQHVAANTHGAALTDAHLAAIAIEHDALFCTNDAGFRRYPGLLWHNPLLTPLTLAEA